MKEKNAYVCEGQRILPYLSIWKAPEISNVSEQEKTQLFRNLT